MGGNKTVWNVLTTNTIYKINENADFTTVQDILTSNISMYNFYDDWKTNYNNIQLSNELSEYDKNIALVYNNNAFTQTMQKLKHIQIYDHMYNGLLLYDT
jgi:hypothetical protein